MKQKLINIIALVFIALNIAAVSVITYVYFHHKQYKQQRLENNETYQKSWNSHPRCKESSVWNIVFNNS